MSEKARVTLGDVLKSFIELVDEYHAHYPETDISCHLCRERVFAEEQLRKKVA